MPATTTTPPHMSAIDEVKSLALSPQLTGQNLQPILAELLRAFDKNGKPIPRAKISLKLLGEQTKVYQIADFTNPESLAQTASDRQKYLFPSDLANFILQIGAWAKSHPPTGEAENQKQQRESLWGLRSDQARKAFLAQIAPGATGQIDEKVVLTKITPFVQQLNRVEQLMVTQPEEESEADDSQTPEMAGVSLSGVTPTPTLVGQAKVVAPPTAAPTEAATTQTEPAATTAPTTSTPPATTPIISDSNRAQIKAVSYETTWVYNRLIFELFTSQGIDVANVDPVVLNQLYQATTQEIWKLDAIELASMFASPSARLRVMQAVYSQMGQDVAMVRAIHNTYQQLKPELVRQAPQTITPASAPGFFRNIGQQILQTDQLANPENAIGNQISRLFNEIGAVTDQVDPALNPHIQTAYTQLDQILSTFGVDYQNLTPGQAETEYKKALLMVKQLSPTQLHLIFFPQLDTISDAEFATIADRLRGLLTSYLSLKSAELVLKTQSNQDLDGVAPDSAAQEVMTQATANPSGVPGTLIDWQRVGSLDDGRPVNNDSQSKRGSRLEANQAKTAQYIAQYRRSWEFLPTQVKLEAYIQAGIGRKFQITPELTKMGIHKIEDLQNLSAKDLDNLNLTFDFDSQIFFTTSLEKILADAKINAKRNLNRKKHGVDRPGEDLILNPDQAEVFDFASEIQAQWFAQNTQLELERQNRVDSYLYFLGEKRKVEVLWLAKEKLREELEQERLKLLLQEEIRTQVVQLEAQEAEYFALRKQMLEAQAVAIENATLHDLSMQDIYQADEAADQLVGPQKLSFGEKIRLLNSGSAMQRKKEVALEIAKQQALAMGEQISLQALSKAGPAGMAAAWTIKHRKQLAKIGLGLTAYTIAMILKYGKAALIGAGIGGVGGAVAGAILGAKIGASIGAFLAPFTGGLSIPIGAVAGGIVGGVAGFVTGAAAGATVGVLIVHSGSSAPASTATYSQPAVKTQGATTARSLNTAARSGAQQGVTTQAVRTSTISQTAPLYVTSPTTTAVGTGAAVATTLSITGAGAAAIGGAGMLATSGAMMLMVLTSLISIWTIFAAFLVPLPVGTNFDPEISNSKYLTLKKTVEPYSIANDPRNVAVQYTITLSPKPGYAIQIKPGGVSDEFTSFTGGEATAQDVNPLPTSPLDETAFPATAFADIQETSYTITLNSGHDALLQNKLNITFDAIDIDAGTDPVEIDAEISAVANLRIGNPKLGCFEFGDAGQRFSQASDTPTSIAWESRDINLVLDIFTSGVGNHPTFVDYLCSRGNITLYRFPRSSEGYGGWAMSSDELGLYEAAFSSRNSMEYTLVHESGHIMDYRNSGLRSQFIGAAGISAASECYTYPFPSHCSEMEKFAEGLALYVVYKKYTFARHGLYAFKSRFPIDYAWYQDNIFDGAEF